MDEKGKDEVGVLARTFNHMSEKIIQLIEDVKEKARMETELKTAQLVQENLFPESDLDTKAWQIASYFRSSTECGGDWWHYYDTPKYLFLMLGDATGHGAPAALVTAAAQSCCTLIFNFDDPSKIEPKNVLENLNRVIHQATKSQVNMTFAIFKIEKETGKVIFANASHNVPLIIPKHSGAGLGMGDIKVIEAAQAPFWV